jgi:hypothetical protein
MGFRLPNRPPSNRRNDTQEQSNDSQSGASRPGLYSTIEWAIMIIDHGQKSIALGFELSKFIRTSHMSSS